MIDFKFTLKTKKQQCRVHACCSHHCHGSSRQPENRVHVCIVFLESGCERVSKGEGGKAFQYSMGTEEKKIK